jgi:hypothetical protein
MVKPVKGIQPIDSENHEEINKVGPNEKANSAKTVLNQSA